MLFDSEVFEIVTRSIAISGTATVIASLWSLPLSYFLASRHRTELAVSIIEALVGIPTVLIGLLLYFLLSSQGPLGFLHLLYTPQAIVVGQAVLVTPLIVSTSYRVLRNAVEVYGELAITLGASEIQAMTIALRESIPGILASIVMGFSRALGELGIALIVGGNIKGLTRVMTTAIALEVSKGEFEKAVMLGLILVVIVVAISITLRILKRLSTY
ncbi:MAG TPA: ABC transporter permease subunit [Ignisphaera sp.]|nr:ABC transporter permease subunit [Ignisphaera sp.]